MDTTMIIKRLVLLQLALGVIYLVVTFVLESRLPELLQEHLASQPESEPSSANSVALVGGIPIVLLYFIAVIGLLCGKSWSKNLYAIVAASSYLLAPLLGPTVEHAVSSTFYDLSTLTIGAVLALLFFTNSAFNKSKHSDAVTRAGV